MFLGIEIGGTKLQLGVGDGQSGRLARLERRQVDAEAGAAGIRAAIDPLARELIDEYAPRGIGIGFGGPVAGGRTVKSHHVAGWNDFPLADWCHATLGLPTVLINDADAAALAEATLGAGRGANPILYVTVGTGIGAGLVLDGRVYRGHGPAALELGHLRPGVESWLPEQNLESQAAGWGIAAQAAQRLQVAGEDPFAAQLRAQYGESPTTQEVAQAAAADNALALDVIVEARQALAWGLAQAITLLAPEAVILGGGVSLMDEALFWQPLPEEVRRYCFPPLADAIDLRRPAMGEEVVVHGALLAAMGEMPTRGIG